MKEYRFSEIEEGLSAEFEATVSKEDIIAFEKITGDKNPLHTDPQYAKETDFKQNVVYGQLVQSYLSTLAGMHIPGKYSLILNVNTNFRKPVFAGDRLTVKGTVKKKESLMQVIVLNTEIKNQKDVLVANGTMMIKVLK